MKRSMFVCGALLLSPLVSVAIVDTNNNGVSDLWEQGFNNGQVFSGSFDPEADDDSDGWTNAQEAAAGTDPLNSNPPDGIIRPDIIHTPAVMGEDNGVPVIITPEAVTVSWPTLVGKQYTLLASPDLSQDSWIEVPDSQFIGEGCIHEFSFETDTGDKWFWRVAVCDVDSDVDGLTDSEEHAFGSNSLLADTDGDGSSDFAEFTNVTNPLIRDTDGDGVLDGDEAKTGTDPLLAADLDEDGMPDDWEKFMSASLLEIFPDPAHWGTRYSHLVAGNLDPAVSYTTDGILAGDVCAVMVNTDDAGTSDGIQFEWQEKDESFGGTYDSANEDYPYRGIGNSSSAEWSRDYVTTEYSDGSTFSSDALLSRFSGLAWAPVSVSQTGSSAYKPRFSAFPFEFEAERICTEAPHAYSNYFTGSMSDTVTSTSGRKKAFRVRLASRKPASEAVSANWLRIKYSGLFNSAINPELIQDISEEETTIEKGGAFSNWFTVEAEAPSGSGGAQDGNNIAATPIGIKPDAGMSGVVGDIIKSAKSGSTIGHFVTPKKSVRLNQEYVILRAIGVTAAQITAGSASQIVEWDGGEAVPSEPLKRRVKRDVAGKMEVKIKIKRNGTVASQMNVWVVWADIALNQTSAPNVWRGQVITPNPPGLVGLGSGVRTGWDFQATIQPSAIISDIERPDFSGAPKSDVPNRNAKNALDNAPFGQPVGKWDISRQMRCRVHSPQIATKDMYDVKGILGGTLYDNLPNADLIQKTTPNPGADSFPQDQLEGNDDGGVVSEDTDPYTAPNIGKLTDSDHPTQPVVIDQLPALGNEIEVKIQFHELCRLEIGGKWFLISDLRPWRLHGKLKKTWIAAVDDADGDGAASGNEGEMRDNGSVSDATNNDW